MMFKSLFPVNGTSLVLLAGPYCPFNNFRHDGIRNFKENPPYTRAL